MPRRRANNQPLTAADARQAIADKMLEAELQANVRSCALASGWLFYHTHRSDRSDEGFPDCVMVRFRSPLTSGGRDRFLWELVVAELKREKKNPTVDQLRWLAAFGVPMAYLPLIAEGRVFTIDQYIWRPMDWLDGTIQRRLSR